MSSKKTIVTVVGSVVALFILGMGIFWLLHTRSTSGSNVPSRVEDGVAEAGPSCINHLREIDAAQQQWARENKKTTNDIPTWDDIIPYGLEGRIPRCPQGGTYTIGRVADPLKCSIGGRGHT